MCTPMSLRHARSRSSWQALSTRSAVCTMRLTAAGIAGEMASTADCDEANWYRTIAVNLKGMWLCLRAEIKQILADGGGSIVNTSSVAGLRGYPGIPAYSASKGGVIQLTRTAALGVRDG